MTRFAFLFLLAFASQFFSQAERVYSQTGTPTDVLVYGATPAGIAAAVSAAKGGCRVTLVEPSDRIGGLVTSGLSNTDFRSFEALTGFFLDFSGRVQTTYEDSYGINSEQAVAAFRGTHGEPEVNLEIFHTMLAEHSDRVSLVFRSPLRSVESTTLGGGRSRIVAVAVGVDGAELTELRAKQFIDASYEGDLMALADEPYHVGRESRAQYGEPMAGNEHGEADGQVQGYNLRLIMTQVESNMRPTPMPDGYDRNDFVDVLRVLESGGISHIFAADRSGIFRAHLPLLPNGKADVNDTPHAPVRLSMPDINDAYPDGDAKTRAEIERAHIYYNIGLLYFLQNDDAVPTNIRREARSWGLCRDEFVDTEGVSPKLYVREARRMVGQHVFTERDTRQASNDARAELHRDSIAIGDYVHNCHGTGRTGTRFNGEHHGEFYKAVPPYQIPYGVIVPAKSENLLVPVACSASHFGFGALRLEPIWCSLGQAAGWAASISISSQLPVQKIPVTMLQEKLHMDGSASIYVADVPPTSPDFSMVQWWGLQGGWHGLAGPDQPKPDSLGGQYNAAFPGHFAELDAPLDSETRERWEALDVSRGVTVDASTTRRSFIRAVYGSHR